MQASIYICAQSWIRFMESLSLISFQLLASQVPFHLADTTLTHHPQRLELRTGPGEVLNGVVGLDRDEELAKGIEDIHALAIGRQDVAVGRDFKAVGHIAGGQIDGAFVRCAGAVRVHVEGVDGSIEISIFHTSFCLYSVVLGETYLCPVALK